MESAARQTAACFRLYFLPIKRITRCPASLKCVTAEGAAVTSDLRVHPPLSAGDMGVGKSCLLHQFTEKKCECFSLL